MKTYVLMEIRPGSVLGAVNTARKIYETPQNGQTLESVYPVTGPYDAVAVLHGSDGAIPEKVIIPVFRGIDDVTRAVICQAVDLT